MLDLTSKLSAGCRVALGLVTLPDWTYYESPPHYLRPGRNPKVVFRLDRPEFKCEASQWKYTQRPANLPAVRKVVLVFYPLRGGEVHVDNLRLVKFKQPAGKQP